MLPEAKLLWKKGKERTLKATGTLTIEALQLAMSQVMKSLIAGM
jgi:hypothetical protein